MNEISIIINGVRYDRHISLYGDECEKCDLSELCWKQPECVQDACIELMNNGYNFKKSDKSFER